MTVLVTVTVTVMMCSLVTVNLWLKITFYHVKPENFYLSMVLVALTTLLDVLNTNLVLLLFKNVVTGFFAVAAKESLITILKKIYMFFLVVNAMNYSITGRKDKKFLLWTLYDINEEEEEEKLKVEEFRVCDCFLDWTLSYRHRFNDDLYDEWRLVDFLLKYRLIISLVIFMQCLVLLLSSVVKNHSIIFRIWMISITIIFSKNATHIRLICDVCFFWRKYCSLNTSVQSVK